MINNDILKRIRYIFDYNDEQMIALFGAADYPVTRALVSDWLKKEDDPEYKLLYDNQLAAFLNGLINQKRGKKEGTQPAIEKKLDNNLILKKLKIALSLKSEEIVEILMMADMRVSIHEVTAFLRKPGQSQYRPFMDQFLRNFLIGLQLKHRGGGSLSGDG